MWVIKINILTKIKLFHLKYIKYFYIRDFLSEEEIKIINNSYIKEKKAIIQSSYKNK